MYEAVNRLGGIAKDEFGNEYYTDEGMQFAVDIMDIINAVKDSYSFDYSINIEAVPKMCGHVKFSLIDLEFQKWITGRKIQYHRERLNERTIFIIDAKV